MLDYATLRSQLHVGRPRAFNPVPLLRAPVDQAAGVPWSAPDVSQLEHRLRLFDCLTRIRFALEAIVLAGIPMQRHLQEPLEWVARGLGAEGIAPSELDHNVATREIMQPTSRMTLAVHQVAMALQHVNKPYPLEADEASSTLLCTFTVFAAASVWRTHHGLDQTPDADDKFLELWWGRCQAIVPIDDVLLAEIEWDSDALIAAWGLQELSAS